jgi:Domain of unknown function (DUF1844)
MAEEESFKVTDRRHRDTEATTDTESRPAAPPPPPTRGPGGPDLSALFVMFATSALMALGEADPATGERRVDLAQAREAVDILLLLRDKTEGNRTEQESRLLEDVLYDLEMRFVRAAAASGR